jgi:hypothetical protein
VIPSADAMAHALIAAAERTGEDLLASLEREGGGARFQYATLSAVAELFEELTWAQRARLCGLGHQPNPHGSVLLASRSRWWPEAGVEARRAALSELRTWRAAQATSTMPPKPLVGFQPAPMSLADRVRRALQDGAHTTVGLSSRLGEKENLVCQVLSLLQFAGHVSADPIPEGQGVRMQLWRIAAATREAARV